MDCTVFVTLHSLCFSHLGEREIQTNSSHVTHDITDLCSYGIQILAVGFLPQGEGEGVEEGGVEGEEGEVEERGEEEEEEKEKEEEE